MLINKMSYDQLNNFKRCITTLSTNNNAIIVSAGSSSGSNYSSSKYSDTMKSFNKTISSNSIRVL